MSEPPGHRGRHGRGRPPWWPEGEPFPPHRGGPPRFVRRLLLLALGFFVAAAALGAWFGWMGHGGWEPGPGRRGGPFFFPLFPLAVLVGVLVISRVVRASAAPLGEVMRAADSVAEGDYTVRVRPAGPADVRRLARSFNEMAERLAAADAQRRDLLADVTHELRTPLSVVRGGIEGIVDGIYNPDRHRLQSLLDSTALMTRLLDDLQVLSTAQAGVLRLEREPLDPATVAQHAAARFRERAAGGGVTIAVEAPDGLPSVEADRARLDQVLGNLLDNALRHAPAGSAVRIAVRADDGGVTFAVHDAGPGIPPERLATIFDRYVRSDASRGSGLGLAIARSLVEAHGGKIGADSVVGGGTTVWFRVPAHPADDDASGRA